MGGAPTQLAHVANRPCPGLWESEEALVPEFSAPRTAARWDPRLPLVPGLGHGPLALAACRDHSL
eukprot:6749381-Alexandrium_andersonii.AAC.1